jgi:hypothetical protein
VPARSAAKGRARGPRAEEPRQHRAEIKLTEAERETLAAAAARAGLALGAYIRQAGLDAAEYRAVPVSTAQRDTLLALIAAVGQVRRAGVNLNQAVTRLNSSGTPGPDLAPAANYCVRVVRGLDETVQKIRRGLQ